ncbi:hypothetical protein V5O48_012262 [Marasmius crinis-equi]|uniref:DNA damage-binding protein 1 n=1 Tax=Marasmius crinis-equi TaxID=585013 RepID=A0ABR3F3K4_9AGAR
MPPTRVTATFHSSSSVLSSVKCSLSSRDRQHLVVGKLDCLEVYSVQQDKLQLECTYQVTGKLRTVKAVAISEHRSNIWVLLDHPDPALLFLSYSESSESNSAKLSLIGREDLYERGGRPVEFCNDVLVHPNGKVAVVSCYTGRLKVFTIDQGQPGTQSDVQIPELNLLSFAFAPLQLESSRYVLSIIHLNHKGEPHLISRDLTVGNSGIDLSTLEASDHLLPAGISASIIPYAGENDMIPRLVAVRPQQLDTDSKFWGGILVIGGSQIILFECSEPQGGSVKRKRDEKQKQKQKDKKPAEEKHRKFTCGVQWPWSEVTAVEPIDPDGRKILIGDRFGRLAILCTIDVKKNGLMLIPLGETSSPKTISYLANQAVFIGSHFGSSQVVKIHLQSTSSDNDPTLEIPSTVKAVEKSLLEKDREPRIDEVDEEEEEEEHDGYKKGRVIYNRGTYLTVLQTFKNIAPILDAVLADTDNSGQPQIVTCSGGANTGSINVVRMGADFDELASVTGLENVTKVWPIRTSYLSSQHSHLIVSTLDDTHVLRLDSGGQTLSRLDSVNSFALDVPTICVHNMAKKGSDGKYEDAAFVVQVTETSAHLLEYDVQSEQWWERDILRCEAPQTNVAADVNASQIVLAQSGGTLASYTIFSGKFKLVLESRLSYSDGNPSNKDDPKHITYQAWRQSEISAVSVNPMKESAFFSTVVAVSFWHTNQIKIYAYSDSGFTFVTQSMPLPATVRSLLFWNFGLSHDTKAPDHHPCLVAGLSDGQLVTFSCIGKARERELRDMKIIPLGNTPISLTPYLVEGRRTVVASGSKSAILEWDKSRLRHSPVMLKGINSVYSFDTSSYPGSLVLSTDSGIHIGRVKDINKMHVRGVSLGLDIPRKIAHVPSLKVFGVATDRVEPYRVGDEEKTSGSFKLLDDSTFEEVAQFRYEKHEIPMSLETLTCSIAEEDEPTTFFCLGTTVMKPEDREPKEGRIVVLSGKRVSSSDFSLETHVLKEVHGAVYSLAVVDGLLAASVNSSVIVFRFEYDPMGSSLHKVAEWNHSYIVTNITSTGNRLVVADYLHSVSLLELQLAKKERKLVTVARDYAPLMPLAVESFDEEAVVGADHHLNLFTFTLQKAEKGRQILKRDGFFHLGEIVSKIFKGSIVPSEKGIQPTHIFTTSTGRIGVIIDIPDDRLANDLALLEIGLGQVYVEESHAKYRAPRIARGRSDADERAYGFIDGDFLEKALQLIEDSPDSEATRTMLSTDVQPLGRITSTREEIHEVLEVLHNMH